MISIFEKVEGNLWEIEELARKLINREIWKKILEKIRKKPSGKKFFSKIR